MIRYLCRIYRFNLSEYDPLYILRVYLIIYIMLTYYSFRKRRDYYIKYNSYEASGEAIMLFNIKSFSTYFTNPE